MQSISLPPLDVLIFFFGVDSGSAPIEAGGQRLGQDRLMVMPHRQPVSGMATDVVEF
jgi:hypothetical protein